MSTYGAQLTLSIEISPAGLRWSLTVRPKAKNDPERGTSSWSDMMEVIMSQDDSADSRQLDFGF